MTEPEFEIVGAFDGEWRFTPHPQYSRPFPRHGDRVDTPGGIGLVVPTGVMTSFRLPDGTYTAEVRPFDSIPEPHMPDPVPAPTQQYVYNARIINVVDGDTVDASISVGFLISITHRLRLADVNAPEVHGPTRDAGLAAAAFARETLLGRDVLIQTRKADDFGRYLARIWVGGDVDFNALMVARGFAVPYRTGQSGV